MSETRGIALEEMEIGQTAESVRIVEEADLDLFAKVSGDYNPVHMDEEYARATPFRGRIAHGALVASFISGVLGNQLPGPGAIFLGLNIVPVYSLAYLVDLFVFNAIEFWSGDNPLE